MAQKDVTAVMVSVQSIKKIAITCRCGVRTVHEIPGELLKTEMIPILSCPACHTCYAVKEGKIARLDDDLEPEKFIEKEMVPHLADGELPNLPVQPASKAVN